MGPWGTPTLTLVHDEDCPSNTALCFLSVKRFFKTFSKLPVILGGIERDQWHEMGVTLVLVQAT